MRVCGSCLDPIEDDAVICFSCLSPTPPDGQKKRLGGTDEELAQALLEDEIRTKYSVTNEEIFGFSRHRGKDET